MLASPGPGFRAISCNLQGAMSRWRQATGAVDRRHTLICPSPIRLPRRGPQRGPKARGRQRGHCKKTGASRPWGTMRETQEKGRGGWRAHGRLQLRVRTLRVPTEWERAGAEGSFHPRAKDGSSSRRVPHLEENLLSKREDEGHLFWSPTRSNLSLVGYSWHSRAEIVIKAK